MRNFIHPLLKKTIIQTRDGAIYKKNWLYFRSFLPLEIDYTTNKLWKKVNKKEIKIVTENTSDKIK